MVYLVSGPNGSQFGTCIYFIAVALANGETVEVAVLVPQARDRRIHIATLVVEVPNIVKPLVGCEF